MNVDSLDNLTRFPQQPSRIVIPYHDHERAHMRNIIPPYQLLQSLPKDIPNAIRDTRRISCIRGKIHSRDIVCCVDGGDESMHLAIGVTRQLPLRPNSEISESLSLTMTTVCLYLYASTTEVINGDLIVCAIA